MAQRILGLDLGAHAVKAVFVESTFRGFAVAGTARAAVPPAEGDASLARFAAPVKALLAESGLSYDSVVVALPGAAASSVSVTLPFTDPRRIEQTVGFEVEGQIPFDLADVAWDWQPLATREGKTDLLVAVVRKEEVAALLAALGEAGVDPRTVVPPAPPYAALFASGAVAPPAAPPPPAEGAAPAEGAPAPEAARDAAPGTEALVDVGRERTSVAVVAGGACEAARTFAFGTSHLARALARELGVTEAEGGALVAAECGGPPVPEELAAKGADPRAGEALRRALVPLVRELRATLRAWRARAGQRRVDRLLLAGEAARLAGLSDVLAPEVEGTVAPLALAGPAAQGIPAAEAPGLALALALALRGHQGSRAPRLNLRRGALAFTRDFEHVKGKVARLGAYAALVLLLAIASAGVKYFALARQEAALDRALCDAEEKIIGRCFSNFEEAQAVLRGRGTIGEALPRVSAVDLFAELSDRVPPEVPMRLERIEVTKDKLHLQGTTEAAENVDRIVAGLKASRCFADARSGGARRRSTDGKFEFSIDASLTCLEQGREPSGGRG
ncbi:MAG TPA: pilus assembly protein PilM [Anaeromyxobacter sp.]|nr:pilus assembly protein PilM [Anaeromyxobacter sp.]